MCSERTGNADADSPAPNSESEETYTREEVAADLRELVTNIEEIHPEPYHGYEGRTALHEKLESTIHDLSDSVTLEAAYRHAAPLVAGAEDAHSRVVPPEGENDEEKRLPVSLTVVGEVIYVDAIYDESLQSILGAQLLDVEGRSIEAMTDQYTELRGSENEYFARMAVGNKIECYEWVDRLLDGQPEHDPSVRFSTETEGEVRLSLSPIPADTEPVEELERSIDLPDETGPRYRLYNDGQTAVFTPGNLSYYREVLEGARQRGAEYAEARARKAYDHHFDDSPPDEIDSLISQIPSMVEVLRELVTDMGDAGTESLVVDLRDNPGGDSRFVQYLGYFLFGWETLVEGTDWTISLKRRTEAHQNRYGVPDSARNEFATFEENPAGYDFGPTFQDRQTGTVERQEAIKRRLAVGTFADELDDEAHEGYYEPDNIVAVTTAGTMSSAFAGVALLTELGGDVVGVPPGQAPLSFGEAVKVTLPNTGLNADIACSLYRWTRNPDGDVLPMTAELTPELFEERYDRAGDAALQFALEWAGEAEQ